MTAHLVLCPKDCAQQADFLTHRAWSPTLCPRTPLEAFRTTEPTPYALAALESKPCFTRSRDLPLLWPESRARALFHRDHLLPILSTDS